MKNSTIARPRHRWLAAATALVVTGTVVASAARSSALGESDIAQARAATADYHRVEAAEAAGYGLPSAGPLHECISSLDGMGAMGYHWINGTLASDDVLDAAAPEALVYEPESNGGLRLVALEFVVFKSVWEASHTGVPVLFGRPLKLIEAPNRYAVPSFYEVHVWTGKHNPDGMFADHNPLVSCEFGS